MPFQPCPTVIQARIVASLDNQDCENVLHFKQPTGDITFSTLLSLGGDILSWLSSQIAPLVTSDVAFRKIVLRDLSLVDGASAEMTGLGVSGSADLPTLPNNVAYVMSLRTGISGRSFRGRAYMFGIPESVVVNNDVDIVYTDAAVAAWSALITTGAIGTTYLWSVLSRRNGGSLRPEGLGFAITQVTVVDTVVDSQRRRLPGRGK